jgi:hypothetical protein
MKRLTACETARHSTGMKIGLQGPVFLVRAVARALALAAGRSLIYVGPGQRDSRFIRSPQ